MQVNIKCVNANGKGSFILDYDTTDLVEDVKRKIQDE